MCLYCGKISIFKVSESSTQILSLNSDSRNASKYVIQGNYNLTIQNLQFSDEGIYECEVTSLKTIRASVTVVGEYPW